MTTNSRTYTGPAQARADAAMVVQCCRLRIPLHLTAGCCTWDTFLTGFADAWPRWFDVPPSEAQWRMAKRDWVAGNAGWEAAHNAQRRAKERVQKIEHEAWANAKGVLTKAAKG